MSNFKAPRLFKVLKELNVSEQTITDFLASHDYADAISGSGLNAKITREDAYLALLDEYKQDKEAASRLGKLREQHRAEMEAAETGGDGIPAAPEAPAAATPTPTPEPVAAPEPEPAPEPVVEADPEPVVESAEPEVVAVEEETVAAPEEAAPAEAVEAEVPVAEEAVAEQAAPAPVEDEEAEEEEAVEAAGDVQTPVASTDDADEEDEAVDPESLLKADRYKLTGTTVLGTFLALDLIRRGVAGFF